MPPEELDDFNVRPHSASSVLRTFIGVHLRDIGGWIAVADLIELCSQGRDPGGTRSALSRLKGKGLVEPEVRDGHAGYRLAPKAIPMLERGDRRIFAHRELQPDSDGWMVVVFSVPDSERHLRHQLRHELIWLGCGMIAPGTWIGPGHLFDEARELLRQRDLHTYTTLLRAVDLKPAGKLADAVAQWWDLDELEQRYLAFLADHTETEQAWDGSDQMAFNEHLRLVDDWRAIPYLDPGLPPEITRPDWPGHRGIELFLRLESVLAGPAARHVAAVTSRTAPAPS
ncbi:PaaX family transcriptional regulator [Nocardioides sp. Iso805N]|uniref:PaaX family transcriptional regulator n=1 Tax=Nocardioides sp. Iso805N TaxID=1283287 RepID=UPI0003690298|nr:PaaX family transcriptional regulator C-terminal domain-containing protein [Nocardioides sp. Iso805N]